MISRLLRIAVWAGIAAVGACDLAPVYEPAQFILPDSYRGSGPFRVAQPLAGVAAPEEWWRSFADPRLDQLEEQLRRANPSLQAAAEAYTQARDLAAEARAGLYPQLGLNGGVSQNKQSAHRLFRSSAGADEEGSNLLVAAASWEPDFWDAVRNNTRAQQRLAQSSAADLATAQLSLQAELATDYIGLRGLDQELDVLREAIVAYQKAVDITRLRWNGGIASGLDLARASSQLASAQAQQSEAALQRELLQHAVAVLVGVTASEFSIPPSKAPTLRVPPIPPGMPSELLQRRPDIAGMERQMAAANAMIGVSRAAFYPHVTFGGAAGFQDSGFNLLNLPNDLWSVGAGAVLPLFEGGLRRAELQRSWAQYAQTRDVYRATVLAAFQEVEDGLALTGRLAVELTQQHEASEQANQALSIANMLYENGLDNYLSVAVAQVQELTTVTSEVQLRTRQLQAAVFLFRALGGGWTTKQLPDERETLPFGPLDYRPPPGSLR